jgi:hypothetical protein
VKFISAAVGAVILVGVIWFFWTDNHEVRETRDPENAAPPPAISVASENQAPTADSPAAGPAVPPSAQPIATSPAGPLQGEAAKDFLHEASTSYDAARLPDIGNYLTHPDPEVRTAAREAIIQLGATEGVALLKAAADKAANTEEATELRKAADFLALPSWTEQRRKNRAAIPSEK